MSVIDGTVMTVVHPSVTRPYNAALPNRASGAACGAAGGATAAELPSCLRMRKSVLPSKAISKVSLSKVLSTSVEHEEKLA